MLRATLKSLLSRKLRLVLSGLAVVLGVMFVAGSFVLTDTIGRSFDAMLRTAFDQTDVVVTGESSTVPGTGAVETEPVPAAVVEQVRAVPGVEDVTASVFVEGARAISNRTGKVVSSGFGAPRFGGNWTGENALIELRAGRGPTADDEVAINALLADTGDFAVGDRIEVLTREPARPFTVVGIFGYSGDRDSLFGETWAAFTTPVAQQLMLGEPDVFTEIDLVAGPDTSPEELRDAIRGAVGDSYVVQTGEEAAEEQADQVEEGLSFFNYILLGFAGVALFVGVFLILNTFSIIIAQRLRELALMRALGASRRQMVGSVLLEAAVIGLLASVVGLALGIGIGALLAAVVVGLFGGAPLAGIGVPPSAVIGSFAVGVVITVVAALIPALRAARVPPVAAMTEAATAVRPLTRITVGGAVVSLAGAGALAYSLTGGAGDGTLWVLLAGVLLVFVGVALLTPLVARPVVSALGRLLAWSTPGELGRRNSGRNPRRTAITAAALMIGVALVTAVSTIFSSLSTSIDRTLQTDLGAELIIAGEQTTATPPVFDPEVLAQARQLPDVEAVAGIWFDFVELPDSGGILYAVDDLAAWREMAQLTATDGSLDRLASGQVVLDDQIADEQGLAPGDTIPIALPHADERPYTVVGVYERGQVQQGYIISSEDAAGLRFPNPTQGFVHVRDGADPEPVQRELERLLDDSPEVLVQDQSGYVEQQTQIFDQILVFVQVLLLLAMAIAVLGVINTLVLSVIERTRELGLLRAIGLSRGATMRMITVESVVISVFGALLGIGVGAGLGAAVVRALRDEGFTHLSFPWTLMVVYLIVAAIVGVVAAVIPAIRAARLNVLAAIAYE
jgi:putative ABC transport system permease protein